MKLTRNISGLLLAMMLLSGVSLSQDLSGSATSKKKTVEQAALEAIGELEYLKSDHKLLEEKSAAQAKTIETQAQLINALREQVSQQAAMITDYKEVVASQKAVVESAQASLKAYSEELVKVRAERDKKGKGRLKAFLAGGLAGILVRLLL